MYKYIWKVVVLGLGVMGFGIVVYLVNIGIFVLLFDIVLNDLIKEEENRGLMKDSLEVCSRLSWQVVKKLLK